MRRAAVVFPVHGSPTVRNSVGCRVVTLLILNGDPVPQTRLHVRLIARRDTEPDAALAKLSALSVKIAGSAPAVHSREPYEKLGLYADAVWSRLEAPRQSLLALYEAIISVAPSGWAANEPDDQFLREAIWDDRNTEEPLFDDAIAWAHVIVSDESAEP